MKQRIQVILVLGMLAAAIRLAWILYERHEESAVPEKQQTVTLDPDLYVTSKKMYLYDLKSAKTEITKQPVWVKGGYAYGYLRYDPATRYADLAHDAGRLWPLQQLEVKELVNGCAPTNAVERHTIQHS